MSKKEFFSTHVDDTTTPELKAALQTVYPLREKRLTVEQLEKSACLTPEGGTTASQSRERLRRRVNLVLGTCDCEHWQLHRHHFLDNPCNHYKAVCRVIAAAVLEVEGEMYSELLEAAIEDIATDCPLLRRNYLAWQTIYARPRVVPIRYGMSDRASLGTIGLKNPAQYRVGFDERGHYHWTQEKLTRAQREACMFVLGTWLGDIRQKPREAA